MHKQDILDRLAKAKTTKAIDSLWDELESRGWSRNGLMYAAFLKRKGEVGAKLTTEEQETISRAAALERHGKTLPPVTGKGSITVKRKKR